MCLSTTINCCGEVLECMDRIGKRRRLTDGCFIFQPECARMFPGVHGATWSQQVIRGFQISHVDDASASGAISRALKIATRFLSERGLGVNWISEDTTAAAVCVSLVLLCAKSATYRYNQETSRSTCVCV